MALLKDGTRVYGTAFANVALVVGTSTSNATVNTSLIQITNSTATANITPLGIVSSIMTVNTSQFSLSTNFVANTTTTVSPLFTTSTATTNSTVNTTAVSVKTSTSNVTITSTAVAVGANVTLNTSTLAVGNLTSNATLNSTSFSVAGNAAIWGITAAFNANTGANGTTEFITTTAAHGFSNGDYVRYITATGNTALTGLVNGSYYFITNANTTAFTVATSYNGATVNVTPTTVSETGHYFYPLRVLASATGVVNSIEFRTLDGLLVANGVTVAVGNSTINTALTTNAIRIGNNTVNSSLTETTLTVRDATISGNLTVSGTTTYINTTNLDVGDNIITLNADVTGATTPTENAGLAVNRGNAANAFFGWDETNDRWYTNSAAIAVAALLTGNVDTTGYINVSSTANVGGAATLRGDVTVNGALTVANTAALGNTTVTGFINVSSTANIGGVLTARANVVANGQLIVSNTASLGNTTINGFAQVGNVTVNASAVTVGNTTVNAVVNSTSFALNTSTAGGSLTVGNSSVNSVLSDTTLTVRNISANGGVGTLGQVLTSGASGNVYWSTASGGASVTVSDTAPVSPSAGNLWWDSGNGVLRIYYFDGTSSQWVDAVPAAGGGGSASITVSDTPPAGPTSGSMWWDSTVGVLRLYYTDGTSNQWVDAVPQGTGGSSVVTYILDDISPYFDGLTTTFNMTADSVALTPDSPYRLKVLVGGIQISPSVTLIDYLNAPENVTYTPGYTVAGSTISFVSAPRSGMAFYATMQTGDTVTPSFVATKQTTNFNALNIMSGY